MYNLIGVIMVIGDIDILRLDEFEIMMIKFFLLDSFVSLIYLKNYFSVVICKYCVIVCIM